MISVDAAVAIVVLIILFGTLFAIILWTRDAPPYDDGVGGAWADYLPEPLEDEGWAEPPPRTKPAWERDDSTPAAGRPSGTDETASEGVDADGSSGTTDSTGRQRPGGA